MIVEINLGTSSAEDWRPVQDISPGQRATALLALALAGGSDPLIIDQPEDDLDNRYIFEEVVQVLARVCETRQVIVATHNANITVPRAHTDYVAVGASYGKSSLMPVTVIWHSPDGRTATLADVSDPPTISSEPKHRMSFTVKRHVPGS